MFSRVIQKGRRIISQNLKCKKCECIRLYTEDKKTIAQRYFFDYIIFKIFEMKS